MTEKEGEEEALDDEGELIQKFFPYPGGYGLSLNNKKKETLEMKLALENLSYNGQNGGDFPFTLKGRTKMFFNCKTVPNTKDGSFQFQYADSD